MRRSAFRSRSRLRDRSDPGLARLDRALHPAPPSAPSAPRRGWETCQGRRRRGWPIGTPPAIAGPPAASSEAIVDSHPRRASLFVRFFEKLKSEILLTAAARVSLIGKRLPKTA